jgi:hypothetical protein
MARQYCRLHDGAGTRSLLDDGATEKAIHAPAKMEVSFRFFDGQRSGSRGWSHRTFFAIRFASSQQLLMNSCVSGLMLRCFNVTIPTGTWPSGCFTCRIFSSRRRAENLHTESGKIEIKRPVASVPSRKFVA